MPLFPVHVLFSGCFVKQHFLRGKMQNILSGFSIFEHFGVLWSSISPLGETVSGRIWRSRLWEPASVVTGLWSVRFHQNTASTSSDDSLLYSPETSSRRQGERANRKGDVESARATSYSRRAAGDWKCWCARGKDISLFLNIVWLRLSFSFAYIRLWYLNI